MRKIGYAWWLVGTLGITTIISYGTSQYLFGVLIAHWQRDLGAGRAAVAGVYSLGLLASGVFGLAAGRLLDRYGPRVPMALGSAASGAALLAMSTVHSAGWLYPLWAGLHALGMGLTYYPVSFAVVTTWCPGHRESALSVLTFVGGTSSLVFTPLAGWLVQETGWRETLVVMGLIQLCVALPLHALVLRNGPADRDRPDRPADGDRPARVSRAVRLRSFWALTIGGALVMLAAHVVFVYLVPYLGERGVAPLTAAAIGGLIGVSSPPSRLALGLLSRVLSPVRLLVLVLVFSGLGVVLLVLTVRPVLLAIGVIMFGAGYGAQAPLRALVLSHQVDPSVYGTLSGLQNLPAAAFGAGGPMIAGLLYDRGGHEWIFAGTAAALLLAAACSAVRTRSRV
ncbi:MFS transporter [Amycolatopsis anabasis]|uniref:MFS transporter n=1 Tax=Amycolatopsis anabasis TaxID=1840409 RepID=UPI00131E8FDD|nr:MFS transporter [Amycolatopsis anabasis]